MPRKSKSKLPKELTTVTKVSKTLALILFITLPIIGFLFGKNYATYTNNNQTVTQNPKIAAFMRNGEVWVKDFVQNKQFKVSQTSKVHYPILSPKGNKVVYNEILHSTGGQGIKTYYTNINTLKEHLVTDQTALNKLWSQNERFLGYKVYNLNNQTYEVYIYDTNTNSNKLVTTSLNKEFKNNNCLNILNGINYITFCQKYINYATNNNKSNVDDFKSYENSNYTKQNYKLKNGKILNNGLVQLEYYTGEPKNPEANWGIAGGSFFVGYDKGVTETYTILLNPQNNVVIDNIPNAVETYYIFN